MKREAELGITLIETLLVLGIAALIIVMSVRYYQSTVYSEQAVAFTTMAQAIAAAQNSLSQGTGTYTSSNSSLSSILPAGGMEQPWGGQVKVVKVKPGTFTIQTTGMDRGVCAIVIKQLMAYNIGGSANASTNTGNWEYNQFCWEIIYNQVPGASKTKN